MLTLHPLLPHIARWVKPDVVVSAVGCRIDEHLEQWPAQASSEPDCPPDFGSGQCASRRGGGGIEDLAKVIRAGVSGSDGLCRGRRAGASG